ncbi:ribonuclease HII [Methylopila jiangsuensis]|uniref:Ribonuclease HII n=1 Tax=Methylopila jiangsuensis TaxID=586230 RepID=A0A9W6N4A9_9HYPH|nr:ribonuclease HII [Methylopila jiangsuensis]MDR6286579.1 ribonuclease HII [Methylopila jiangsuensis]GLK77081.1 ribonuclease HII [Methylopila jiangsuensis]
MRHPRPIKLRPVATFEREAAAHARGLRGVAGVDEAGRGPLAGPVVTAAVILDPDAIPHGLADSKALTAARREKLFAEIVRHAQVAVASASPERIEALNIRGATLWAMGRAMAGLPTRPGFALIDGRDVPPGLPCPADAVIDGDALSLSIAAASIVAKVVRDRMMKRLGEACPGYGFEKHMGYGTAAHLEALRRLGPSPHHRRGFAPVAALIAAGRAAS